MQKYEHVYLTPGENALLQSAIQHGIEHLRQQVNKLIDSEAPKVYEARMQVRKFQAQIEVLEDIMKAVDTAQAIYPNEHISPMRRA